MAINRRVAVGGSLAIVAIATPLVMYWEGKENDPYLDLVNKLTVCYGETKNVQQRRYSDAECADMLQRRLGEFWQQIAHCLPADSPPHVKAAALSFSYNVGAEAMCKSTFSRRLLAGDWPGACAELDRWVMAGGRRVQGLANRRKAERELCEGRGSVASLGATG